MKKSYKLIAARNEGLFQWKNVMRNQLSFTQGDISTPAGVDPEVFSGQMFIDELNDGTLIININSSPQKTYLSHEDYLRGEKNKFFIIHSCNNILFRNKEKRIIVPSGDSIIIPAWNEYIEESFSNRTSISIITDVNSICNNYKDMQKLLWQRVSHMKYGLEINKIISNFYEKHSDRFNNKNYNVLNGLLSLEVETLPEKPLKPEEYGAAKLPLILNFIKNNIKNPALRLSTVAKMLGVTERMVQYILFRNGLKFHDILTQERCGLLAHKIKNNVHTNVSVLMMESGFENISTACRAFKKIYNVTPKQYQKDNTNTHIQKLMP